LVNSAVRSCATIRRLCQALTGPFPFTSLANDCADAGCTENVDIRKDGHIDLQSEGNIACGTIDYIPNTLRDSDNFRTNYRLFSVYCLWQANLDVTERQEDLVKDKASPCERHDDIWGRRSKTPLILSLGIRYRSGQIQAPTALNPEKEHPVLNE